MNHTNQHSDHSSAATFVGGVLLGGVFGAVLALLFAPVSGEQAREQITKATEEAVHRGQDFVEQAKDRTDEVLANAQDKVETLAQRARNNADRMMDPVSQS